MSHVRSVLCPPDSHRNALQTPLCWAGSVSGILGDTALIRVQPGRERVGKART